MRTNGRTARQIPKSITLHVKGLTCSAGLPILWLTAVDNIFALQSALHVRFRNLALLRQALVHRSYLNESDIPNVESNERMEFLGDAVLGLIVAEELYQRFPDLPEGHLTAMRARIVRGSALASVGARLDLGRYLVFGRGEEQSGGRRRGINLARAVEAIIGAMYLDQGLEATRAVLQQLLDDEFKALQQGELLLDAKSRLQHVGQSLYKLTPRYVTTGAEGPDHAKSFTVDVCLGDDVVGSGNGSTKREAQQEAARSALTRLASGTIEASKDEIAHE